MLTIRQEELLGEFGDHLHLLRAIAELVMEANAHVVPAALPMKVEIAEAIGGLGSAYERLCSDLEAAPEDKEDGS